MTAPAIRWDVITTAPTGAAYGQTFEDEGTARDFAAAMTAHGYRAEVLDIETTPSLRAALIEAAQFFGDPVLGQSAEGLR
jgi:hypothetical protein